MLSSNAGSALKSVTASFLNNLWLTSARTRRPIKTLSRSTHTHSLPVSHQHHRADVASQIAVNGIATRTNSTLPVKTFAHMETVATPQTASQNGRKNKPHGFREARIFTCKVPDLACIEMRCPILSLKPSGSLIIVTISKEAPLLRRTPLEAGAAAALRHHVRR